jgi:tetratricopeptide (TPR) repeat protein
MGAVYLAEHVDLEKRVALKTLLAATAQDPKAIERFRQEARAASKIGNPFICDVTDFGSLPDGQVFFVMEYIDGVSLSRILESERALSAARAIAILRQICKALGAAHQKGIVHLDIKPDNIMLTSQGRRGDMVKVVDFGIAGLDTFETSSKSRKLEEKVVGTPDYLAPERIRRKGYDHRSDIYSLGVMAYEMLTGTCPFFNDDVVATITQHITDKPQPLRQRAPDRAIPAGLELVVLQMLEKVPDARPQSMAVVEAMLCEAQITAHIQTAWDDLEIPEVEESWRKKLIEGMPSFRSRRLRRLALILGITALFGVGAALYFGLRQPKEIVTYVEVTKTEEAESVAPFIRRAVLAAETERFFQPVEDSALYNIERAEAEAERLHTKSNGAFSLRRIYGNQFRSLGTALLSAGLTDLALLRFKEALRFLPSDPDLQARVEAYVIKRRGSDRVESTSGSGKANKSVKMDAAEASAASLFAAVTGGHFSQARIHLAKLLENDREGLLAARLADDFRKRAEKRWDEGKRADARLHYQILLELDPKDTVAKERSSGRDWETASASSEASPTPSFVMNPTKEAKKAVLSEAAEAAIGAVRDRTISGRLTKEGHEALAQGNLARAESVFTKALRSDPTNPETLAGLAEVYFENARYTEALDYARRAVAIRPKTPRYHVILGDSYFKLLRLDAALASYQRAANLAPNSEGIKARIERVRSRLRK